MSQISVNDWIADERQRTQRQREIIDCCRLANQSARIAFELAAAHSDRALVKSAQLDQRLTMLLSRLPSPQLGARDQGRPLLRILAQLDQADAAASAILTSNAGTDIDALAETLGKLIEEMETNLAQLIQGQRTIQSGS
jgi:hypothetical protein